MTNCPHCNGQTSSAHLQCPHCLKPINQPQHANGVPIIGAKPATFDVQDGGKRIVITLSEENAIPIVGIMSAPPAQRIAQLLIYTCAAVLVEMEQAETPDGAERAAPGSSIVKAN